MRLIRSKKSFPWIGSLLLLALISACNLPAPAENPISQPGNTTTEPFATFIPSNTPVPTTAPSPAAPTAAPTTTKPGPTLAPTAPAAPPHSFAVFDQKKSEVRGIQISNGAELFKYNVPGTNWMGPGRAQVVGTTVYYQSEKDKAVYRVSKNGTTRLDFLPKELSLYFLISPDGKQIAWGVDPWAAGAQAPSSQLWIAAIDGAGAKKIGSIEAADNSKFLTLKPLRWQPDGKLVFNYMPTGIGGYILFGGFAGAAVYDPASGKTQTLLAPTAAGSGGLCVHQVSLDLKVVITSCATANRAQLSLQNVADGTQTEIPVVPDQGAAGSPLFSPGNNWLAYAVARSQPDNELGKALLVPAAGGTPTDLVVFSAGYVNVSAWVDEDRLLVEHIDGELSSVWLVQRDGSGLSKLADGYFVGAIP